MPISGAFYLRNFGGTKLHITAERPPAREEREQCSTLGERLGENFWGKVLGVRGKIFGERIIGSEKASGFIDHETGKKVIDDKNSLITMRITYESIRLEYSTGIHINAACWDAGKSYAIGGGFGKSSDEINAGILHYKRSALRTIDLFNEKEDRTHSIETFSNLSPSKKEHKINTTLTFWDVYHEYEAYASKLNDWAVKTRKKYETIRYNLKSFRDWRRKHGPSPLRGDIRLF